MIVKSRIKKHISANQWQYLIITLLFTIGIIVGNYKVPALEGGVRNHLLDLINGYLLGNNQVDINGSKLLFLAFLNQAKTFMLIWFLGLTVIGMPLILAIVLLKGMALGFTVGFLVQEKAGVGVLISLLTILPQNLIYIPLLIVWSVVGIKFSIYIAVGRQVSGISLGRALLSYSFLLLMLLALVAIGAFIEGIFSPWLLRQFV
ncbi:Sporulation stage II, protein M [Syntrophomonas zehnderi OL-4]|uniref:Sporulation stage II, protein M n=1 Tax=Syntrophomonas zehnderi OL-4 TaxID=690567 RepID=A0A0E3W354_9FIRM|nr:stage II sporulation protein M [Syntrophomonas zehnderi]CFX50837.1 Sporulation stage II, protein M [Syntrophomonas zehnderi OL-4]